MVRTKPLDEIRKTLDDSGKNHGLPFTRNMARYCDAEYRVRRQVRRIIDERTGKMISLAENCLILEGTICRGPIGKSCPKQTHLFWRNVWLAKTESESDSDDETSGRRFLPLRKAGQ
jgi:hypothetical protein